MRRRVDSAATRARRPAACWPSSSAASRRSPSISNPTPHGGHSAPERAADTTPGGAGDARTEAGSMAGSARHRRRQPDRGTGHNRRREGSGAYHGGGGAGGGKE